MSFFILIDKENRNSFLWFSESETSVRKRGGNNEKIKRNKKTELSFFLSGFFWWKIKKQLLLFIYFLFFSGPEREVAIKRGNRDFKGGRASRPSGREWARRTNQCLVVGPAGIFGREGI